MKKRGLTTVLCGIACLSLLATVAQASPIDNPGLGNGPPQVQDSNCPGLRLRINDHKGQGGPPDWLDPPGQHISAHNWAFHHIEENAN